MMSVQTDSVVRIGITDEKVGQDVLRQSVCGGDKRLNLVPSTRRILLLGLSAVRSSVIAD